VIPPTWRAALTELLAALDPTTYGAATRAHLRALRELLTRG
jgi:hypothetical protein